MGVSFSNSQILWSGQCIHRAGLPLSLGGKWRWILAVLLHFCIAPISSEAVVLSPRSSTSSDKTSPDLALALFSTPDTQRLFEVTSQDWV